MDPKVLTRQSLLSILIVFSGFQCIILPEQDSSGLCAPVLLANKPKNPGRNGGEVENEESISDADLDNIVGVGDSSQLEVL